MVPDETYKEELASKPIVLKGEAVTLVRALMVRTTETDPTSVVLRLLRKAAAEWNI